MEITSNGYKGDERRQCNGKAKLKLTLWEWIRLSIWAIFIIATSVVAWVTTKGSITANAQEIAEASVERINIVEINKIQDDNILILQGTVERIQMDTKKLLEYREEDHKILYKILGALGSG